jgi:hypothetical protein
VVDSLDVSLCRRGNADGVHALPRRLADVQPLA